MAPQAHPERVASPPLPRHACQPRRLARSPPRLWSELPAETQKQVARAVAGLMRRFFIDRSCADLKSERVIRMDDSAASLRIPHARR